jgi:hypothetical protein
MKLGIHLATITRANNTLVKTPTPTMNRLRASGPPSSPGQVVPVAPQLCQAVSPPTNAGTRQIKCTR